MKSNVKKAGGLLGEQPKVGILGAGQLGKMLAHAAANWDLPLYFLDKAANFPAAPYAHQFFQGDFKNYEDVLAFGRAMDIITIEIEHVNLEALQQLVKEGKIVHPNPNSLAIIKDKGIQKRFYQEKGFPTSSFQFFDSAADIQQAVSDEILNIPFVQKSRGEGYDGKGVAIVRTSQDLVKLIDAPSIVEPLVPIEKEIAVVAVRNSAGEIRCFDAVEMEFEPEANLVAFLFAPANISEEIKTQANNLAKELIEAFDICGLLAIEFFLTQSGELLINEVAPRPHNSGHHTIDACVSSQFEQHLRGILNLPLGDTQLLQPAVMINLLGEKGFQGPVKYEGVSEMMKIAGMHLHLYGKVETRSMRKMGHATVMNSDLETAKKMARAAQVIFKIKS